VTVPLIDTSRCEFTIQTHQSDIVGGKWTTINKLLSWPMFETCGSTTLPSWKLRIDFQKFTHLNEVSYELHMFQTQNL